MVGHHDLGGRGFNGDVYAFGDHAYIGSWGRDPRSGIDCPNQGVRIVDISVPTTPQLVGALDHPRLTSAEDVVVVHAEGPKFSGEIAAVGIQPCGSERKRIFRGLMFFDVTDPTAPQKLGRWKTAPHTHGCHEIDMTVTRSGSVLAACASPYAEEHNRAGVLVIDVTDPSDLRKVATFNLVKDGPRRVEVGCFKAWYAHSVRFFGQGRHLYASYWDSGTIHLRVRVARGLLRVIETRRIVPRDEDGDNHSVSFANGGDLLLINSEDWSPLSCAQSGAWGELYIYDNSDPTRTRFLSTFATPNARTARNEDDGIYSVHNTEVVNDDQVFASWYSDGIRWIDLSDPADPTEVGYFVPPTTEDPHGQFPTAPLVWGVWPDPARNVILASDINSGLWILQPTGLGDY